jgi:hypothetical protein
MSFDITKNYIAGRLKGLGYSESKQAFDFDNAPKNEYNNSFILSVESGQLTDEGNKLNIRYIDNQTWVVQLAFSKSEHNDVINRDIMYRKIEPIIKDLDDPSNWLGTIRFLRYVEWNVEPLENYFLLTIKLTVQDSVSY